MEVRGTSARKDKEVVSVFVFPTDEEMESIKKKVEVGLELEDWEIWVYKEFM